MAAGRILVVDDEPTVVHVVGDVLEASGWEVDRALDAEEALSLLRGGSPAVAFLDIVLPGMNGLELLQTIKARSPETVVVMMTSHASIETAVEALQNGAYDYLDKPFEDLEVISLTAGRALERHELTVRNRVLAEEQVQRNDELSATVARLSSLIDAGRAMGDFNSLDGLLDFFVGLVARELAVDRVTERIEPLRVYAVGIHGVL